MPAAFKDRRNVSAILWLIIGVLSTGVLTQSLSVRQEIVVCAEEKALEFDGEEDDRDGAKTVVFVLIVSNGFPSSQNYQTSVGSNLILKSHDLCRSYAGRAPPRC
jgi:hypothetical protein